MSVLRYLLAVTCLGMAYTPHLFAQDEAHLRVALEGQNVTLKIAMPATASGVDIYPGAGRPLDFQKYGDRLKESGASIKSGESILITKVKVKDDMIEIQLGGGGYGTFGDALGGLLTNHGADSGAAQQARIANTRTEALSSGSRFNLHYPNGMTPSQLTVASVVQALQAYAAFAPDLVAAASPAPAQTASADPPTVAPADQHASIRKGMSLEDVDRLAGKPVSSKTNGQLLTNTYKWQDGTLEADFFNGVLVAYRVTSG